MANPNDLIVIKRIKKGGHGHHGGAWKVAYADFVTAMMAFFLLLWLLSSTSKAQKEGIADYFTPTVGIKDEEGIGFKGGEKASPKGSKKEDLSPPGVIFGTVSGPVQKDPKTLNKEDYDAENELFAKAERELKKAFEEDPSLRQYKDNILVDITPDGLRIQIIDQDKLSMFALGSADLVPQAKTILGKISEVIAKLPNPVTITGHTDSKMYKNSQGYTNWELSADRANASRRYLVHEAKFPEARIGRVIGKADREHLLPNTPESPLNRRISILLAHKSSEANLPVPAALLRQPKASDPKPNLELQPPTPEKP